MGSTDVTPPHHPTFSVHLSKSQIEDIFSAVFGDAQILGINQLERGQSFNNRIYFVDAIIGSTRRDFALKVSGQFFGGRKVENEVSCLMMLAYYCPKVPTPRIVAWSLDGACCERTPRLDASLGQVVIHTVSAAIGGNSLQSRSWVLLERLPGKRLEIDGDTRPEPQHATLMKQLASHVHSWRTKFPQYQQFGNIRLRRRDSDDPSHSLFKLEVAGLILCESIDQDCRISTKLDYLLRLFDNAIQTLMTKPSFSARHRQRIQKTLHKFDLRNELEKLTIFGRTINREACFTHYDFSPRNMLITIDERSGLPLVSGILDFEFAGFCPVEEEFTNDAVGNEGDWPPQLYQIYLEELARLGSRVPPAGGISVDLGDASKVDTRTQLVGRPFLQRQWQEALLLAHLVDDIAPWQIAAGSYEEEELAEKLSKAAERVETDIAELFKQQ